MSVGHILMGLLAQGEQHGYELKQLHDDLFPAVRPLAYGQIYAALERLERKGYIELAETVRVDGPDRRVYQLSAVGRSELERWLTEVDLPTEYVANPFAVKATLLLTMLGSTDARDFLRRQRRAHLERMREFTAARTNPHASIAEVLAADFAIGHLAADIEWMETATERVAELSFTHVSIPPTSPSKESS